MKPHSREFLIAEIQRRAAFHKAQSRLVVDYYRIRRKRAFPLLTRKLPVSEMEIPGIPKYPWAIWFFWEAEERWNSLSWVARNDRDTDADALYWSEIQALAEWPLYRQFNEPDLSIGHAARNLWNALNRDDLPARLNQSIKNAFRRILEEGLPRSDALHEAYSSPDQILREERPESLLRNIPWIGTVGLALAAHGCQHPAAEKLDRRLALLLDTYLDYRRHGHAEGTAYDGYILDFIIPWLENLPRDRVRPFLQQERFEDILEQSLFLPVPGDLGRISEIGDSEPLQMPFHLTAQARLLAFRHDPRALWLLRRVPLSYLRTDAIAALLNTDPEAVEAAPEGGFQDGHYTLSLRTGYAAKDLAVVASFSRSRMPHLPPDAGTLEIGTAGRWIIADPGYQQYIPNSEREFTLGVAAHNAPVLNGQAPGSVLSQRNFSALVEDGLYRLDLELTTAYPDWDGVAEIQRTLWLAESRRIVVADTLPDDGVETVQYYWNAHPDCAWWGDSAGICLYLPEATLWIQSPQTPLREQDIVRTRGSRGHLTLASNRTPDLPVVWWVFSLGKEPAALDLQNENRRLVIAEEEYVLSS